MDSCLNGQMTLRSLPSKPAPAGKNPKPWYALALVAFLVIAAGGAALYFYGLSASGSDLEKRGELTVTRLTNTNYVRDATISRDGNYFVYNEHLGDSSRVWLQQIGKSARVEIIPGGKWQICCKIVLAGRQILVFYGDQCAGKT